MKFIKEKGYKLWKTEDKDPETLYHRTLRHYQKNVTDRVLEKGYPLCKTNDKVCLNITEVEYHNVNGTSREMYLRHENDKGEWCKLALDDVSKDTIDRYEEILIDLWGKFCE